MPGYRRIALRRTGGLTAMRLEVEVDLRSGDPASTELAALLQGLDVAAAGARAASAPPVPDGYRYELTVDRGDGRQELSFEDGAMPPELRPVIRVLERRALDELRARRRERGGGLSAGP